MVAPLDLNRLIDPAAVRADVEEIFRAGLQSLTFNDLSELPYFVMCHTLQRGAKISTWDTTILSANVLRQKIIHLLHRMPAEVAVRYEVAEALLGMDNETAGLNLTGRQEVAARRYSPAKPVSGGAIRKKPYGQQAKLVEYLAEELIASEEGARWQQTATPESAWNTLGGELHTLLSFPALPSNSEWESALGYRWLDYERTLICSHDLALLTFKTRVRLRIIRNHTRIYRHIYPMSLDPVLVRVGQPTVSVVREPASSSAEFVGTVVLSPRYPDWRIDFFDLGTATQAQDELFLVFQHEYQNPHHDPPVHVMATPEFDDIEHFELGAEHLSIDGRSRTVLNGPLVLGSPLRGKPQTLFVQPPYEFVRYQLRDQADWPRVQELELQMAELRQTVTDLDYEYHTYFEVVSAPDRLTKNE